LDSIYIVALLPILFIGAAYINLRKFYEEANEKKDIIDSFYLALEYNLSKPILNALESISNKSKGNKAKEAIRKGITNRLLSGNFNEYISKILKERGLEDIDYKSLGRSIYLREQEAPIKLHYLEPYMQRNGTLSMFTSTIIPSFIILGFIASSITSRNANAGPLFFSIIVSLPVLYALGAYASQRRLIDVFES
jgi:hypothetical protein